MMVRPVIVLRDRDPLELGDFLAPLCASKSDGNLRERGTTCHTRLQEILLLVSSLAMLSTSPNHYPDFGS